MINKILFHRILTLLTLFCVMLTACTAAPSMSPTPTALARTATATATVATETPTTVPTPTEIPVGAFNPAYPEAGPRPAGETVYFDKNTNEWAKPNLEDAEKPFYYKTVTDPKTGEVLKQGWFKNIGETSLMDEQGYNFDLPVRFWCSEGVRCATIYHEPSPTFISKTDSLSREVESRLEERVTGRRLGRSGDPKSSTPEDAKKFRQELAAGSVVLQFTSARGTFEFTVNSKINPKPSINVFVVDESVFDAVVPDFDWGTWKAITIGDKDGGDVNIIVSTTAKKPMEAMSVDDFRDLVMNPIARFIVLQEQDAQAYLGYMGTGIDNIVTWSTKESDGNGPFLQIIYPTK